MEQINLARLKKCMCRAQEGEELTLAFLGGSITQGSLAEDARNTYARQVFSWWERAFPAAAFRYVNAGIGGTDSLYGVSRVVQDVLVYQPDFVMVDFSVNDKAEGFYQETYEGVIRKLLGWKSKPAVVLLNNVFYDTGLNAEGFHNEVGAWYRLPHVSIRETLYERMKAGVYTREELTPDGLHPNDKGHRLVAEEITAFLEKVKMHMGEMEEETALPAPMTENAYENAKRLDSKGIFPTLMGFRADTEEKTDYFDHFKNGWLGWKAGDKISFEIEASCIAVQYRKTINKPALCAVLTLDGDKGNRVLLDGNFEEDWGDCLYLESVLHHGKREKHRVAIEIPPNQKQGATPFYLMALIVA